MVLRLAGVSRRRFLQGGLVVAGGLALPGVVSACSSTSSSSTPSTVKPKKGGTLRVGIVGATNETLDPTKTSAQTDFARVANIFDQLVTVVGAKVVLQAAESITPNGDGSMWTITLRDATFQNGNPVTAADVIWSFNYLAHPATNFAPPGYVYIDLANMKATDARTVQVPMKQPRADFLDLIQEHCWVMPQETSDFSKPIGSGPFQVVSFDPGQSCVMSAFANYHGGAPLLDGLVINTLTDADAGLEGVESGQLDYAAGISPTSARVASTDPKVQIMDNGTANSHALTWIMKTTVAPFDDVRVRQAMAYATDRQALIHVAFGKYGSIGNDVIGQGLPGFDSALKPRAYDPSMAKQLLAAAGQSNLSFSLRVFDSPPGSVAAAQLWVQQLATIGVTCTLNTVPVSDEYNDAEQIASTIQFLAFVNRSTIVTIGEFVTPAGDPAYNGAYTPAPFNALVNQAATTVDPAARQVIINQLSQMLYNEGPYVVWGYANGIAAAAPGVRGVVIGQTSPLFANASLG